MTTRVDGAEVRCKVCGSTKRFSYRSYFNQNEEMTSREADAAALSDAKEHAREHAREEHGIDLDKVPYERKVFPKRLPRNDIFVKQFGRQVA